MKIQIEKLTKEYNEKKVLDINQLEIEKGILCGIIGPNGSGKSTLLKIISDIEEKSTGKIFYGENEDKKPPLDFMTFVFQKPYLIRTTVEKNIAYPLKIRKWSKEEIDKRVDELIKEMGLEENRTQNAGELSGGEMQKVALARALSFKPKLLLLDEPTANIDPNTIATMEKIIVKANKEDNTTVCIVTHNLLQAKRICTHVMLMNKGQVVEKNTTYNIFEEPKEKTTQKFINGELLI